MITQKTVFSVPAFGLYCHVCFPDQKNPSLGRHWAILIQCVLLWGADKYLCGINPITSIATPYGPDGSRCKPRCETTFSAPAQVHPASCVVATGPLFPGGKAAGVWRWSPIPRSDTGACAVRVLGMWRDSCASEHHNLTFSLHYHFLIYLVTGSDTVVLLAYDVRFHERVYSLVSIAAGRLERVRLVLH
jgi:hypothetical protein